jgi:xanthine dehydrogenase YagR molybdenum-binding subunit
MRLQEDQQNARADTPKRTEMMHVGIAQEEVKTVSKEIPAGEPPALAPNDQLKVIGKPTARWDGRAKVTGAARYTTDVRLPGMLYGRMVNAVVPHAKVLSVDTSAAEKYPGVKAVHVLTHVSGNAELRDKSKEIPSSYPIVRYAGQPIAAVAAVSLQIAEDAANLVKVDYQQLPFVIDRDVAKQPDAPLVYPGPADQAGTAGGGGGPKNVQQIGNVHGPAEKRTGYVKEGFADADVTVEGRFATQVQTHSALETHGFVADWKPDGLTVYASTQSTSSVREELAFVFKLPKSKVRVITEYMGGGFGAKFGAGNAGIMATYLSQKAKAPVWLMLDRL